MNYKTLANGYINKSKYFEEGSNRPQYIGNIEIDENIAKNDMVQIALWERDGSYSMKISKTDN